MHRRIMFPTVADESPGAISRNDFDRTWRAHNAQARNSANR